MNDDNAKQSNVQSANGEVSEKDIAHAIRQLTYRKERSKRLKRAMEYLRQHPELVRKEEGR